MGSNVVPGQAGPSCIRKVIEQTRETEASRECSSVAFASDLVSGFPS